MNKKHDRHKKISLRKMICYVMMITMLLGSLPPVELPVAGNVFDLNVFRTIYGGLVDLLSIHAKAESAIMTEDHFNTSGAEGYSVEIENGIRTVTINNAAQLLEYSIAYHTFPENDHSTDILILSTTAGTVWDLAGAECVVGDANYGGFQSIGSDSLPFKGMVRMSGTDTIKVNLDKPFFGTIDQKAQVCELCLSRRTTSPQTVFSPMLAQKIINQGGITQPLAMSVILAADTSNESSVISDFAGVIGTIDTGVSVTLTVTNNAKFANGHANVNSTSGPVGLLCCEMKENAVLAGTIQNGSNNNYSVSSTAGSAGGLVGKMENGSRLILLDSAFGSITQDVTGSTYAGGIVGEAVGAYIGSTDIARSADASEISIEITDGFKAKKTTLNGASGAGYLFGYYVNTATTFPAVNDIPEQDIDDRVFTIGSTFRDVSLTFASNNVGGYFGVLNNNSNGAVVTIDGGVSGIDTIQDNDPKLLVTDFGEGHNTQGGVIGEYSASDLTNTLYIRNMYVYTGGNKNVCNYGGAIADVSGSEDAAYIKIEDFYTRQPQGVTDGKAGGLIWNSGNSFVDVAGYIRINGNCNGGLIHTMPGGVLRLAGTTDLKNLTADGLIADNRTNGLIYSKGDGQTEGTWKLIRNSASIDDVKSWGEVVRLTSEGDIKTDPEDTGTDYIIDEMLLATEHKITVPTINLAAISGRDDFIRLALHIQHKVSESSTGAALVMEGSDSATILGNDITIASDSADIDLAGTGILGLTRDNGTNNKYTGTFDGNNKTISLAIGEAYGLKSNGSDSAENINGNDGSTGRIYRHKYNGLFAKLGNGAKISNLNVGGTIYIGNSVSDNSADEPLSTGAFGATIEKDTSIDFVNDTSSVQVYLYGAKKYAYTGGFISRIRADNVVLNFTDCTSSVTFHDNRGDTGDSEVFFGGFVSMIAARENGNKKGIKLNFLKDETGCVLSGSYETIRKVQAVKYGGLVAYIENGRGEKDNWSSRIINIESLAIEGLSLSAEVCNSSNPNNFGCAAMLGYEWYGADVTIKELTVGANAPCSVSLKSGSRDNVKMAGLCTICTGHWRIDKLDILGLSVTGNGTSSFGMLINTAFRPKNDDNVHAMYLELTDATEYKIARSAAQVSISGIADGKYDEIALYSWNAFNSRKSVADNGASVLSINTDAEGTPLIMTGAGCNTYQNQTEFGRSTSPNPNSRYYYNLYSIRNKLTADGNTMTDAERFLMWSLSEYASSLIKSYFANGYNSGKPAYSFVNSGDIDMTGLSYYPIDYTGDLTFNNYSRIKFCNEEIELGETSGTGVTSGTGGNIDDGKARTTAGTDTSTDGSIPHTQHYMMHCGLFRNYITEKKTIQTQNMTLEGSVGIYNGGSGFLISGKLGGANNNITFKPNGDSKAYMISLNGAYVYGAATDVYAPLLINKVEKNTTLHLYGVKTTDSNGVYEAKQASEDWYAASSLIGMVGASDGSSTGINLDLSRLTLDSRKTEGNLSTDDSLKTAYGTSRSIFSRATLLHWFVYNESCSGTYNYTYAEDWTNGHQVTYGQEVTYTIDNNEDYPVSAGSYTDYFGSQQLHYSGDRLHFTDPTSASSDAFFDFSKSVFLPYVGDFDHMESGAHVAKYHELDVNLMVSSLNIGCGTYNDPYVIYEPGQLMTLAKILKGDSVDPGFRVNLPNSDKTHLVTQTGDRNLYWCTADTDHIAFGPDNGTYKRADDVENNPATSNTYTSDQVRKYLAGAYYQIMTDITLPGKYAGLGAGDSANSGAFAFHGVIVGKQGELRKIGGAEDETEIRYPVITNKSANPLIVASNGSVIKNITIKVWGVEKGISQNSPKSTLFEYNAGCAAYGAVIGKIMGGDNVIDNVPVTFENTVFTMGSGAQIVPVGGYVGALVNGGLFFRNMSGNISGLASSENSAVLSEGVSFGDALTGILSSMQYLYVNPIIGRVINGYAVTEGAVYRPLETDVTMKNSTKNYSIADIASGDAVTIGDASIEADSAQDLFVISMIVGSGTGNTGSSISYDKDAFKTTHIGTYADVGCKQEKTKAAGQADSVCDAILFADGYTELTDASATPYLAYKYTSNAENAQSITKSTNRTYYEISMSGSPWTLPDGYRGIGGFNSTNKQEKLGVSSINAGGTSMVIRLNSEYFTYNQAYDNYFFTDDGNTNTDPNCGMGLFNCLLPGDNCVIEHLTLCGQTVVDVYDADTGSRYAITSDDRKHYLSVGLLAGTKADDGNSITLNDLTVNASGLGAYSLKDSGGLIGSISGSGTVNVTNCNATNLIVHAGRNAGGFFGKVSSPVRINEESGNSVLNVNAIILEEGLDNWLDCGAGGVIGNENNAIIKQVTVRKASGSDGRICSIANSANNGPYNKFSAGGLIGVSQPNVNTNLIENCAVNDITLQGNRSGGAVGHYSTGSKTAQISHVVINGDTAGSGTKAVIERKGNDGDCGSFIGYINKTTVLIENCETGNYAIKNNGGSAGGCVGYVTGSSVLKLKNYLIKNCEFRSDRYAGGIVGGISNGTFSGYNIALQDITKTNKYQADLVGNYTYSNSTLRIVGFSRKNVPAVSTANDRSVLCSNAVGISGTSQTVLPSGSYIIFADYTGTGFDGSANLSNPLVKDGENVNIASSVGAEQPYVLINSYRTIDDNTLLTGDGAADTVEHLAITQILQDLDAADRNAYTYAVDGGASFDSSHLSTMNTQFGNGTVSNDFAILVLEDTNRYNSQSMINSYLQLLTNTRFNFADRSANAAICSTNLYKMEMQGGKFVKQDGEANLKIDGANRFYMLNDKNNVDTGMTTMFSLIDIQFYDPTDTSQNPEVVYHLYVPALVKKVLKYSFEIATGSGTIYDKSWYGTPGVGQNRYEKILLENLGTPGTLYFSYGYERTQKEWQDALEYGENLLLNYDKILNMEEVTEALADMEADTMLVLVDPNQGDRSFYARFSGAWADGKLSLYKSTEDSAFKTSLGSSGVPFKPVSMCDLMNIRVEENASTGKFVRLADETNATVRVDGYYYRPYDSMTDVGDNAPETRYSLTVVNKKGVTQPPEDAQETITLTESYYLSIFTKETTTPNDDTINYYQVTSPTQLSGGAAVAKAVSIQNVLVLFGNLYQQTGMTVTADPYPNDAEKANPALITENNNMVRTKLQTTVRLTDTAKTYGIDSKLDDSVDIYQSFVLYLTKHENGVDTKGVVGKPAVSATYTITPVTPNGQYPAEGISPTGTQKCELNYVEASCGRSIKGFLKNAGGATISAEVVMTYGTLDQRNEQFPVDTSSGEPENYTTVSASSNVAYDSGKTAYSKNQISGNDIHNMKYHISNGKKAVLEYNAIVDGKGNPYGQLGINANDLDDSTGKVKVKTGAVYLLKDVSEDVPISEYPYVKVTLKLSQKQSLSTNYGNALEIGHYLNNVRVKGSGITTASPQKYQGGEYVAAGADDTEYVFILNRAQLKTNNDVDILTIPIEFEVYTGSDTFESQDFMYGNFRVFVSAQCLKTSNAESGMALAKNYIVYTNAKLLTEFINDGN